MGIPGFWKWCERKFSSAFSDRNSASGIYDYVYIDINMLVHRCLDADISQRGILRKLCIKLNQLMMQFKPRHGLYLLVDGPTSLAKLSEQRTRRFHADRRRESDDDEEDDEEEDEDAAGDHEVSRAEITPGTKFMMALDYELKKWAKSIAAKRKGLRVIVSPSTASGEGEFKAIRYIIQHTLKKGRQGMKMRLSGLDNDDNDSHIIVTSDADVIIMGLACLANGIYVYNPSVASLCNINEFVNRLCSHPDHLCHSILDVADLRLRFVLSIFLKGNDYLPIVLSSDFVECLRACRSAKRLLDISNQNSKTFVTLNLNVFAKLLHQLTPCDHTTAKRSAKVEDYLFGLLWLLNSYLSGCIVDNRYFCEQSVSTVEIIGHLNWIKKQKTETIEGLSSRLKDRLLASLNSISHHSALPPLMFLLSITPLRQAQILPKCLRKLCKKVSFQFKAGNIAEMIETIQSHFTKFSATYPSTLHERCRFHPDSCFLSSSSSSVKLLKETSLDFSTKWCTLLEMVQNSNDEEEEDVHNHNEEGSLAEPRTDEQNDNSVPDMTTASGGLNEETIRIEIERDRRALLRRHITLEAFENHLMQWTNSDDSLSLWRKAVVTSMKQRLDFFLRMEQNSLVVAQGAPSKESLTVLAPPSGPNLPTGILNQNMDTIQEKQHLNKVSENGSKRKRTNIML